MLLKVDAAQLELRVKIFLSQDPVGVEEIWKMEAGTYDPHTENQARFKLPNRTISKNWIYQAIFCDAFGPEGLKGAAGGFSAKADFRHVFQGTKAEKVNEWLKVLEAFFDKYKGMYAHGHELIHQATTNGQIVVPSGRFFPIAPELNYYGELDWPRTKILNYPVQGFSADLVQVARLTAYDTWDSSKGLLINTVHDDIEADVDNDPEVVYNNSILLEQSFKDIPKNFKKKYGSEINIPLSGEVKYGICLNESFMKKFKRETFFQDYKDYTEKYGTFRNLSN